MSGWIKVHRSVQDHFLWLSEPFTKAQAWVDLIIIANHKEGKIIVRGIPITVLRGQVGWSEVELSNRWKWSRTKVRNFLKMLEKEQQIKQQKNNVISLFTIVNYDRYQEEKQQKRQQSGQQKDTNKNDKEIKEEYIYPFENFWNLYDKKRDTKDCKEIWSKLSDSDKNKIMIHAADYVKHTEKQFRKDPIRYLKKQCWLDEIIKTGQDSKVISINNQPKADFVINRPKTSAK